MTFNVLSAVHFELDLAWSRAKRDFATAAFTTGYARAYINRADTGTPFFVNNTLTFSLTWPSDEAGEPLLSRYNARVLGAEAVVSFRANSSCVPINQIRFNLQKSGFSTIFDSSGKPVSFTHPTASWESISRTFCDGTPSCVNTFSGISTDGVWFSPYGAWVLKVIQPEPPIDLSEVQQVAVTMTVRAFSLRTRDLPMFATGRCDQDSCDYPADSLECVARRVAVGGGGFGGGGPPAPIRGCTALYEACDSVLPCCNDGFCMRHSVNVGCTGTNRTTIAEAYRCVPPLLMKT